MNINKGEYENEMIDGELGEKNKFRCFLSCSDNVNEREREAFHS